MKPRAIPFGLFIGAPLLLISCGREPLEPSDTVPSSAGDAGAASPDVPNAGAKLNGTWSGELSVNAVGISWGPFARLTISFGADGTVSALQFASNFPPPHTYGSAPEDFPLQGTRDLHLVPHSVYTIRATVEAADFGADHFHLRHHVVGTGTTPPTDYVEDVAGKLEGGTLNVTYSFNGTLLIASIAASASGQLRPD